MKFNEVIEPEKENTDFNNQIYFLTDIDCVKNDWIGGFSRLEKKIIYKFAKKPILHLFSGNSDIGKIRIDINPNSKATKIQDVFEFIQKKQKTPFKTILLDPIYSSEERQEIWKDKYEILGIKRDNLYVFPYDTRKTKKLWNFFKKELPLRIIIKSLNFYTIPNYNLIQGYCLYVGAFKPNRCLGIYQIKYKKIWEYF